MSSPEDLPEEEQKVLAEAEEALEQERAENEEQQ